MIANGSLGGEKRGTLSCRVLTVKPTTQGFCSCRRHSTIRCGVAVAQPPAGVGIVVHHTPRRPLPDRRRSCRPSRSAAQCIVLLAQAGHAGFISTQVTDAPEHPTWLVLCAIESGMVGLTTLQKHSQGYGLRNHITERIPQTSTRGLDTDLL